MTYQITKVTGLNSDQEATLVSSFGEGENQLAGLLSLVCDDAFARGRQLLSETADEYFEEEGTLATRLSNLFDKLKDQLKDSESYSLILVAISSKALYVIGHGQVRVILKRGEGLITILEGGSDQVVSGFLESSDRVLLATQSLFDNIGNDLLANLKLSQIDWEEDLSIKIAEKMGLAGLLIDAQESEEVQTEEIPNIAPTEATEPNYRAPRINIVERIFSGIAWVRNKLPGGGKVRLIVALALILVLITGVSLKYKSVKDNEKLNHFNELLGSAKQQYSEGVNLKTLNPTEAVNKLNQAKGELDQALKLFPKNADALALKSQIEQGFGQKHTQVSFDQYLDLNLIKNGFSAKTLSLSGDTLLILDSSSNNLVTIDLAKKSHVILGETDKIGRAKLASLNGESAFVLSDKGILRIDTESKKASVSAKPDKDWGEIVDLVGFAGNIYLLDLKLNQIWKYIAITGGFSDKRNYLSDGVKANLSGTIRMQIESSVYILKSGGEILRFTRGESDNFSLGGLDKGIKDPKSIFTSSDTDNLYILDSGNSRMVVTSKTGEYQAQYLGDKFGTASDLVVDEVGERVYLLDGNKIYVVELK